MKPAPPVTRIIASCSFILGTGRLDIFSLSPPPQPSPTRGEGALLLPPPLWGRVGVGGKGAQFNRAQYNYTFPSLSEEPIRTAHAILALDHCRRYNHLPESFRCRASCSSRNQGEDKLCQAPFPVWTPILKTKRSGRVSTTSSCRACIKFCSPA